MNKSNHTCAQNSPLRRFYFASVLGALLLFIASSSQANLIHHYTFDNPANLGEDSVGSRDLAVQNRGSGGTVSQVPIVGDGNGRVHFGIARITDETPLSQTTDTLNGSWLEHDAGASTTLANFSVALWFRTDVNQNDGFSSMFSNGPSNHFQIDNGDNLGPPDDIRLLGQAGVSRLAPDAFAVNDWFHLAVTYDGANTRFFIDGQQFGADMAANPGNEFREIRIGSNRGQSRLFDGDFEDLRVYDNALSPSEIALLAIPEPSSLALLGLGVMLLAGMRKKMAFKNAG